MSLKQMAKETLLRRGKAQVDLSLHTFFISVNVLISCLLAFLLIICGVEEIYRVSLFSMRKFASL